MFKRLMVAGILAACLLPAQDEMGGGGRGGGGRGGDAAGGMGGGPMPRRQTKGEQFSQKLKLNKEQEEEADKIVRAAMERLGAVRMEMDQKRAKIAGALIDGKPADEVQKLTADFASSSAQAMKIEADAFAKVWATLKPNQQNKADQAFELLAGLFAQAGRPRGGPGGPGGRGARGPGRQQ